MTCDWSPSTCACSCTVLYWVESWGWFDWKWKFQIVFFELFKSGKFPNKLAWICCWALTWFCIVCIVFYWGETGCLLTCSVWLSGLSGCFSFEAFKLVYTVQYPSKKTISHTNPLKLPVLWTDIATRNCLAHTTIQYGTASWNTSNTQLARVR